MRRFLHVRHDPLEHIHCALGMRFKIVVFCVLNDFFASIIITSGLLGRANVMKNPSFLDHHYAPSAFITVRGGILYRDRLDLIRLL
jgi:hypothetical protein